MARGKLFVDVLDEVLEGYEPDRPATPPRMSPRFGTPSIFCFEPRNIRHGASPAPWLSASVATAPPPPAGPAGRTLSPRQREAFDAFVQLGARIEDDFTHAELRTMFRSLALRYHPDRYPGSSDSERAHLSVRFAQLHHAYESLKSVSVCSN
jgi:hypothetical protein